MVATAALGAVLALIAPAAHAAPKYVVTTIAQLGEPLRQIAGGRADVVWLLGEGVDPHLYRLNRSDVAHLMRADLIVHNGLHLEAQMGEMLKRLASRTRVVAAAEAIPADRLLPWAGTLHDPHVWMDPMLWGRAIDAAVAGLAEIDPDNADYYRERARAYAAELDRLNAHAAALVRQVPADRRVLVTAHDAFGYFGRAYGVEVLGVQGVSTETEPGLRRVEELVDLIVTRGIPAVFVETSVSDRNVRALIDGAAARGHHIRVGGSLYSDAMGIPGSPAGTYIGMIDHNVTAIARALGAPAPEVFQPRSW